MPIGLKKYKIHQVFLIKILTFIIVETEIKV